MTILKHSAHVCTVPGKNCCTSIDQIRDIVLAKYKHPDSLHRAAFLQLLDEGYITAVHIHGAAFPEGSDYRVRSCKYLVEVVSTVKHIEELGLHVYIQSTYTRGEVVRTDGRDVCTIYVTSARPKELIAEIKRLEEQKVDWFISL